MLMNCMLEDASAQMTDKNFRVSIHHLSDASEQGYGQYSYIRMVDEEGRIHCSLLLGKSRFVLIPRLEPTAAVLSVKIACLLKKELNFWEVHHYFWTDSKEVIGYIMNDKRRFKTFVAYQIYKIKEKTNVDQLSSIPTTKKSSRWRKSFNELECWMGKFK